MTGDWNVGRCGHGDRVGDVGYYSYADVCG